MVEYVRRETRLPGNKEKSIMMERVYHAGIGEPLHWIALAVFQPARFRVTYEPGGFRQRGLMLARLIVPLFLLSWVLAMLVRFIPLPPHVLVWSDEAHGLPWNQWEVAAIGVTFGLLVGLLFGVIRGVSFGIVVSLTAGVVFGLPGVYGMLHTDVLGAWLVPAFALAAGLALSLSFGLAWGLAFSVIVGLAAGVGIAGPDLVADLVIGLGFSLALGMRGGIFARLEVSLVLGLILGVIGGLTAGLPSGLASGLMAGMGSMLGLSRVPGRMKGKEQEAEDLDQDSSRFDHDKYHA
jgi:hypothetical protein